MTWVGVVMECGIDTDRGQVYTCVVLASELTWSCINGFITV